MTDTQHPEPERPDEDNLERAADEGQLPGVAAEDAEEQRGEDHSATETRKVKPTTRAAATSSAGSACTNA
jgi:hypothetical protein